jgi:hypothetical protein
VEVHLVDADTLRGVRVQDGWIAVRLVAPDLCLGAAGEGAEGLELWLIRLPAPTIDPLSQRWIGQHDIVFRKLRGLVGDLVSAHLREAMRQAGPAAECDVDGFRNPGARA